MQTLRFDSECGEVVIEMCTDRAPKTCQYFADLASVGAFDSASILRIVTKNGLQPDEECPINIVQIAPSQRFDSPRHEVVHEDTRQTGLSHKKWTVSAARFDLGELYGSFFICLDDEPELDFGGRRQPDGQGFAAFGEVIEGFDALERVFTRAEPSEMLTKEIPVRNVVIVERESASAFDNQQKEVLK